MSQELGVQAALELELRNASALQLTQASQMNATQRAEERSRIREVVLSMSVEAVKAHIASAEASDNASKRCALLLYSLSTVLPEDTSEVMATCQERLQIYLVAVMDRLVKDDAFAPYAPIVCRVATSAMTGVGQDCCSQVVDLVMQAIALQAGAVSHLLSLLPVALSQLSAAGGTASDADSAVLRQAKTQQTVSKLCALAWPAPLVAPILTALRNVSVPAAQEQLLTDKAFKACAKLGPEQIAEAAMSAALLAGPNISVTRITSVCTLLDTLCAEAFSKGNEKRATMQHAQADLIKKLQSQLVKDKTAASAWLKAYKTCQPASAAALALTASLASTSKFAAPALEAVKGSLLHVLKHNEALQTSLWLAEINSATCSSLQPTAALLQSVAQVPGETCARALLQAATHLMGAAKLKDVELASLQELSQLDGGGLQWWTVDCSIASKLCLAGVALLDLVRTCAAAVLLAEVSLLSVTSVNKRSLYAHTERLTAALQRLFRSPDVMK